MISENNNPKSKAKLIIQALEGYTTDGRIILETLNIPLSTEYKVVSKLKADLRPDWKQSSG